MVRGGVHLPHGLGIDPGGFFAQHMEALGKGLLGQDGVLVVGRGDEHRVAQAAADELAALGEDGDAGQVFLRPGAAGLPAVRHGR